MVLRRMFQKYHRLHIEVTFLAPCRFYLSIVEPRIVKSRIAESRTPNSSVEAENL